jgi:hypothetical protein
MSGVVNFKAIKSKAKKPPSSSFRVKRNPLSAAPRPTGENLIWTYKNIFHLFTIF